MYYLIIPGLSIFSINKMYILTNFASIKRIFFLLYVVILYVYKIIIIKNQ